MLFLGLGTGLGTAMIVNGTVEPMELGHLPYKKRTYEDYVGRAGLERCGKKKWRFYVADIVERLIAALQPDDTVIGGGNVTKLKALPPHCRPGENANAFRGGFQLWANDNVVPPELPPRHARSRAKDVRGLERMQQTSFGAVEAEPDASPLARAPVRPFPGAICAGDDRTNI